MTTFIRGIIGSSFLLFAGCSKVVSVCPHFPVPSQPVLDKIDALRNNEVDAWVGELYKLHLKLQYCRGE